MPEKGSEWSTDAEMLDNGFARTPRTIAASLGLICVVGLFTIALSVITMARLADGKAQIDAERLVTTALAGIENGLIVMTRDYAWWEALYDNVRNRNEQLVYENAGTGAEESGTFSRILITDIHSAPIYGWGAGGEGENDTDVLPAAIVAEMDAAVRRGEVSPQNVALGWYVIGGELHVVAASYLLPFDLDRIEPGALSTVVTSRHFDDEILQDVAHQILMSDMRIEIASVDGAPAAADDTRESVSLRSIDGTEIALLSWANPVPGSEVLSWLAPWLLAVAALVISLSVVVGRHAYRMALVILTSQDEALASARTDMLTSLYNRTGFAGLAGDPDVVSAIRARRASVVYLDLNRFKEINDSVGHAAGDEALRTVATRMRTLARDGAILGRMGGDEMVALFLDDPGGTRAQDFATRMIDLGHVPIPLGDEHYTISAAIGIAIASEEGMRLDDLIQRADDAMLEGKKSRSAVPYIYTDAVDEALRVRRQIEARLRDHIRLHASGEAGFSLVYQPIVDMAAGKTGSVEALLRWTDATLGPIRPDIFIPIAETSGLIVSLGDIVLTEAARVLAARPNLRMSVNVSPVQLLDRNFAPRLVALLRSHGVDPGRMMLEITETALIEVPETALQRIETLRSAGFHFALDDFGTGFASISYLERFPFTVLKIDRAFVQNICTDPQKEILFRSMVQMSQAFRLEVVAEGIETFEQSVMVRKAGCRREQGYLHSRPVPLEQLGDLGMPGADLAADTERSA